MRYTIILILFLFLQNIYAQQGRMEIYVTDIIAIPQNSMSEFVTIPLQTKLDRKLYSFAQNNNKIIAFNPYNTTRDQYHLVKLNSRNKDYELEVIVPPNRFANMYFVTTLIQDESQFLTVEFSLYHKSFEDVVFAQSKAYDKTKGYKLKWNKFINTSFEEFFSPKNIATFDDRIEVLKVEKEELAEKKRLEKAYTTKQTKVKRSKNGQVTIRELQEALRDKGYDPGPNDNVLGTRTKVALTKFQKDNNLKVGQLDKATMKALGFF